MCNPAAAAILSITTQEQRDKSDAKVAAHSDYHMPKMAGRANELVMMLNKRRDNRSMMLNDEWWWSFGECVSTFVCVCIVYMLCINWVIARGPEKQTSLTKIGMFLISFISLCVFFAIAVMSAYNLWSSYSVWPFAELIDSHWAAWNVLFLFCCSSAPRSTSFVAHTPWNVEHL